MYKPTKMILPRIRGYYYSVPLFFLFFWSIRLKKYAVIQENALFALSFSLGFFPRC
jgi:hypothetical protein